MCFLINSHKMNPLFNSLSFIAVALELDPECILVAFELVFRAVHAPFQTTKNRRLFAANGAEEETEFLSERGNVNPQDERQFGNYNWFCAIFMI